MVTSSQDPSFMTTRPDIGITLNVGNVCNADGVCTYKTGKSCQLLFF